MGLMAGESKNLIQPAFHSLVSQIIQGIGQRIGQGIERYIA